MKTSKFIAVIACLFVAVRAFAIEGLQITVPPTNVVLSWPSDPSETYLIQYRHTLNATDSWTTLADFYPPDYTGLNIAYFYDTNIDYGSSGSSGGGMSPMMAGSFSGSSSATLSTSMTPAQRAQWLSEMISNITPPTITRTSGVRTASRTYLPQTPSPQPQGGPGGGTTNNYIPGSGFYRVVRDGVHMVGISNNMVLSGVVTIPIELGNDEGQVVSLCMNSDDSPVSSSIQSAPNINPLAITVDTTTVPNGIHDLFASARWEDTNGNSWEYDSPNFSVTTSNELTFESWIPAFGELGNSLLIKATSAHTNVNWNVDIYDSRNNYVASLTGYSPDGYIYTTWDLTDTNGVQHTNDNFFTCKISTPYADPPKPTYKQLDPWLGPGQWVFGVQHAFDGLMDSETLYEELNGFCGQAQSSFGVIPTPVSGNPYAIHFQDTQEAATWFTFKQALFSPYARNVCYFGHGGPNGLGYNQYSTNTSVIVSEISSILHTIPAGQTNAHKFRFVFLDGCSTARGTLPEAFGIIHQENVPSIDYYNASLRPSAFVGWTADKWIGYNIGNDINYDHVNFITFMQLDMLQNGDSINGAKSYAASLVQYGVVTSEFKIFGCWDLAFGAFNN